MLYNNKEMSQKQNEHLNHYVNALIEDDVKEDNSEGTEEDDKTTFKEFYEFIDNFKKQFPKMNTNDYFRIMNSEEFKEDKDELVKNFLEDFDPSSHDPRMLDILISLSSIGINIPKRPLLTTLVENLKIEE
jgi:hypothetical protein